VFLAGAKVGGILCESAPGWRDRLVIGIGINVNNSLAAAPDDIRAAARSLIDYDGIARDLTATLLDVLSSLDNRWNELLELDFAVLANAYRNRCFLTGKALTVTSGSKSIAGRCLGIDDSGALLLRTESGVQALISGTIERWDDNP
jgi:BirA family biotin operon repressor/biotin-[acetyl-CoA-carboxylase] ligase